MLYHLGSSPTKPGILAVIRAYFFDTPDDLQLVPSLDPEILHVQRRGFIHPCVVVRDKIPGEGQSHYFFEYVSQLSK